ncbi:MAG: GAF domain-containing protein [Anaerolineae bacterium]|nr:GAF domain-containing protein [Anaerolineae bacterium]MCA9891792.1 GAF domain-containing protein [Anaerolineae bacterium]
MIKTWYQLNEIAQAVLKAAEATDVQETLQRIATASRELVKCRYAALGIPDGEGGLRYFMTSGLSDEHIKQIPHLPKGHGLIGEIMRQRDAIVLDDMEDDPRATGFPHNHPDMTSFLGVPIVLGHQMFGMIYLCDRDDGEPFDAEDRTLIETLAGYAALTIANAEVNEQQQQLKLLEQRESIGMELHDGVIQSLYGLGMQVDLMRQKDCVTGEELDTIVDSLNDTIEEIRRYILHLRSHNKSRYTIREQIKNIKKRLFVPDRIDVQIDAPDVPPPFPSTVFESIGLIINEALSNAIRHAEATEIYIRTLEKDGQFIVIVKDNGIGFEPGRTSGNGTNGLGLRNMQHRARLYGGHVDVQSSPGGGTSIHVMIPIQA